VVDACDVIFVPGRGCTGTLCSGELLKLVDVVVSRCQSPSNLRFFATLRAFRSTLRHAENIWKRSHSAADWSSFKSLRNQYHKLILSSKKRVLLQPSIFRRPNSRRPATTSATTSTMAASVAVNLVMLDSGGTAPYRGAHSAVTYGLC